MSKIILFHYPNSPFSKRVLWYLALRGIPYAECIQPRILPRPDLARLGINYRRIPLLAIGRDVYLDSRLIIQILEQEKGGPAGKNPAHQLSVSQQAAATPEQRILERLLHSFMMDTDFFKHVVNVRLVKTPAINNPAFIKDREDFFGGVLDTTPEKISATRPQAINEVKAILDLIETTLSADDRQWILNTSNPTLADIETAWPVHFLFAVELPAEDEISILQYPKVFAWIERLEKTVNAAESRLSKPETLLGDEVADRIIKSAYSSNSHNDGKEDYIKTQGLEKGQLVQVWPTDTGRNHRTLGKLVDIDRHQVILETVGENVVRVHAPRHGFQVAAYQTS